MQPSRRRPLLAAALTAAAFTLPASAAHAAGGGAVPAFDGHRTLALGAGITDPRALVTGDLDGDGRPDLVAGSANGGTGAVSVLRGTGAGAFAAPLSSPYALGTTGGVGALALGDVNGDGRPDVVATIGSGTVDDDQLVALAGDGTGVLTAGTPTAVSGTELAGIALADLDGDGDLDALTASTTATTADQLGIVENGGAAGLVPSSSTGATGTQLATGVATGDLDGDGTPDALVISRNAGTGSAWVATGHALALAATGTPVTVGADPVAVTLADVDGDGDLDGLVLDGSAPQLTLLRNDGNGGLTATTIPVTGLLGGTGIATGDLNGDGALDVVVTDGANGTAGVLDGDGTGAFADPSWSATAAGTRAPVVADLDGDGLLDVATADSAADRLSLLENVGTAAPSGALSGAFGTETVGRTGAARTVTITDPGASAALRVTNVTTTGDAADDFLITGDACTGTTVASGGADACAVRVRFAPSATGDRNASLRIRYATAGGGTATATVALSGTGAGETSTTVDQGSTSTTATTATTVTTTTTATPPAAPAQVTKTPTLQPSRRTAPATLILTLSHRVLTSKSGRPVTVGFALGRAASLVLRVKQHARTLEIVRARGREGRGSLKWDGMLGSRAARRGTYRLDLYAVAADGRRARASIALTVK
ncbi:FG-GAP-like repeat-containing protein [Conexibacter woesei]|uniref:FG-GAP-like repeat-containing protein n=1 Tax=Conexibacter woesei TaxID=191495 RepID=UPI00047AA0D7|nr:FG-GAP-like repeat-containing protein [Conexibacter woesei]